MGRKIKFTEKELEALINRAYLDGYNKGFSAGKQYAIFENNTINSIRDAFGLPPIGSGISFGPGKVYAGDELLGEVTEIKINGG